MRNKYGATPLLMASQNGHDEVVKLLLASKADVSAAHNNGATPLWVASDTPIRLEMLDDPALDVIW